MSLKMERENLKERATTVTNDAERLSSRTQSKEHPWIEKYENRIV